MAATLAISALRKCKAPIQLTRHLAKPVFLRRVGAARAGAYATFASLASSNNAGRKPNLMERRLAANLAADMRSTAA